jgi:peptide chain release factor 3
LNFGTGLVKTPLLAAIGPLQFEVFQYRLQAEYAAESRLETASWQWVRWWRKQGVEDGWLPDLPSGVAHAVDQDSRPLVLFADDWALRNFIQRNPSVELSALPFGQDVAMVAPTREGAQRGRAVRRP